MGSEKLRVVWSEEKKILPTLFCLGSTFPIQGVDVALQDTAQGHFPGSLIRALMTPIFLWSRLALIPGQN